MNDNETIFIVARDGLGVGIFAALLYIFTSRGEPPGFRLVPSTTDAWVGYWFRTLILTLLVSLFLSALPGAHPAALGALTSSALLLIVSSAGGSRTHRNLSGVGFVLSVATLLWLHFFRAG